MSAVPKRLLTPQEYLAQERLADFRSEYYRGEVFAMAGTSYKHCLVKENTARETGNQLKGGPCRVVSTDMRVKVNATGLYTYPDIIITCDQPQLEDEVFDTLLNPRVIFEILFDSTEKYDRGAKFAQYRQLPSLQEYVLIAQDRVMVERNVRQANESWLMTSFANLAAILELESVPVRIPLAEIYRDVEFPDNPGR